MKYPVIVLTCLFLSVMVTGNTQTAFPRPVPFSQTQGFKYIEAFHGTTNISGRGLAVVIGFHYSSSTPQESLSEFNEIQAPHRLILPMGKFTKRSGYSFFPADYYSKDSLTQMNIAKATVDDIAKFVRAIGEQCECKPVVAGFSQGGDISLLLAIYYPELISAAFPFAGFIHRQRFEEAISHAQTSAPIYIFQGEEDKIISMDYTRKEVSELKPYFNITLKTYPGLGHDFSPAMKQDYSALISKIIE